MPLGHFRPALVVISISLSAGIYLQTLTCRHCHHIESGGLPHYDKKIQVLPADEQAHKSDFFISLPEHSNCSSGCATGYSVFQVINIKAQEGLLYVIKSRYFYEVIVSDYRPSPASIENA